MICGSIAVYDRFVASYVEKSGVPFLSVDYRLSPEHPGTTLVDDTHWALMWLIAHAAERQRRPCLPAIPSPCDCPLSVVRPPTSS
ncbi:hypothetical protein GCM10023175_58040 [Pseudonocardia xishanensis]|uniref:Alpha/beta hydrolase fold-3 domain-containing protein n=2 Tax=Pseudonocardia xishanensis TaxID=630995 RepID=A0ABP8S1K2_9PSEU